MTRTTTTLQFQQRFAALRREAAELERFSDPADLFDWLHAPTEDGAGRNKVLCALIRASQREPEPAVTLLLLALWPGLDAVRRRLGLPGRWDEVASEVASQAVQAIAAFDLSRATWVAATILRNVERDLRRKRRKENAIAAGELPLNESTPAGPPSAFAASAGADADHGAAILVDRLRPSLGRDAGLVVAVAVAGLRQHEVAAIAGCTPAAARKRYQRALARLRQNFCEAA